MHDVCQKHEAYREWKDGRSKASLALDYGVSARTISRWIDSVEERVIAQTGVFQKVEYTSEEYQIANAIYEYNHNGVSKTCIAENMGISRSTLNRRIEKFQEKFGVLVEGEDLKEKDVVEALDKVHYNVVGSSKSISITKSVNGKVEGTVTASDSKSEVFKKVLDLIMSRNMNQEDLAEGYILLQPSKAIEAFTEGKLHVDVKNEKIVYKPEDGIEFPISSKLSNRIINTIQEKGVDGAKSLLNFMNKLMENPSYRAVNELYGFLEHNDIVINQEGNFYAWKVVGSTYLDKYTGTMDNSVGKTLKVARNQVDENSERTCSHGLHVCAKSYIKHYGNSSDRVVKVEVNPTDVVAIPKDYNDSKMRCCGYKVVEDVTNNFFF